MSAASEYWLWHEVREWLARGLLGEDDAAAEKVELGAAEHLALDGFEPADVSLHLAAAPVERAAVADGVVVLEGSGAG
ncbi:hypothetical protein Daura_31065 [Dactylosporangium aurantiacum]|uniref:Uncharacterized protein n=1 Tax=Dactylosporangium aurantiacum TaxID=35754 RepID=A0A9Q9MG32_9ACTN|nr:hypothetical protein [Dactylosporangium aurantiacum]MDG6107281.1 hypothetical protein [Dactylosporangium aurantiacum]UWZ51191.1 hypothetical protein Daura_31065 [Dactylosporangium aurantiacum]